MANKEPWPLSFGPLINVIFTLVGTLVVIPFPKNVQLMTSGISGGEKVWACFCLFLLFVFLFVCLFFCGCCIFVSAFSCPHLHNAFCRQYTWKREKNKNKNTFKEGVKFPKLECTVEIRTELLGIVLEPSGWLSLLWYASFPSVWCRWWLMLVTLVREKPVKIHLFFFLFWLFKKPLKASMQIWSLPDVRFPRHEWHFIKKPSRGHCEASFYWSL